MNTNTMKKNLAELGVYVEYATKDVGRGDQRGWWNKNQFIGNAEQLQNYLEELK